MKTMNNVFSIEDLCDSFWANPSHDMFRSQSEWELQRFLEEAASPTSISVASSAADNAIPPPSSFHSQQSITRSQDAQLNDGLLQLKSPHKTSPLLSDPAPAPLTSHPAPTIPLNSDQYRAILKTKLDLACAAVALRVPSGKPGDLSTTADNQKQTPQLGTLGQGSLITSSEPLASSITVPVLPAVQRKSGVQVRQATSGSSRDDSDDDDLEGDIKTSESTDPTDVRHARRMLSNRESARRSRRRKQEHMNELESQVGQLRGDHSSLLKRLTDMNQKCDEAAVDNRILKADIETLRAKVKMAEETVKRVTGINPLSFARSNTPSAGMPFGRNPIATPTAVSARSQQPNCNQYFNQTGNMPHQGLGNSNVMSPTANPQSEVGGKNMSAMHPFKN